MDNTAATFTGTTDQTALDDRAQLWIDERANGSTYREIAERHKVSHEWVRQVILAAGTPTGPRNWAAAHRKETQAEQLTNWLQEHGPTPATVLYEKFDLTPARLSELITIYEVPKSYIMAGTSTRHSTNTLESVAAAVTAVWERILIDEPGTPGLSVGLYDRSRINGDPSPALITSRWGWRTICEKAGVPTAGTGRPSYTPRWSDEDLLDWIERYTRDQLAEGTRVTFDGYDQWRRHQDGAPSGALVRTRLRRSGYQSWAAMVAAATSDT